MDNNNNTNIYVEPFLYHNIIVEKSSNIIIEITKPKFEKTVLQNTENHEGASNGYYKIINTNNKYLLYYRALAHDCYVNSKTTHYLTEELVKYECFCLAESNDGLDFEKKNYNIINNNSINNNVLKHDLFCHNFFPYYSIKESIFLGISGTRMFNGGLYLFNSNNGIEWKQLRCILTENEILNDWCHSNHFDTHNCIVYNKLEDMYYIYVRHNNKDYRSIQYTKSRDLIKFEKCKEIIINDINGKIKNSNKSNQIYSPGIFEYPNSNYILAIPSIGTQSVKYCNTMLISKNYNEWYTITNTLFNNNINDDDINDDDINDDDIMNVNGIVISPNKDKFYIYINNNTLLKNTCINCYSFPLNRINKINSIGSGHIIIDFISLINNKLWINFETFNDGYIYLELIDKNDKINNISNKAYGNENNFLVTWETDNNNINENFKIKFNLYNCNLYSLSYNI